MASDRSGNTVRMRVELDPCINVAMQQNDVPPIKRLALDNLGSSALTDVRVTITADPAFAVTSTLWLAALPVGGSHVFAEAPLAMSPSYLSGLLEREAGQLQFVVSSGDTELARETQPVELLAWNEWSGLRSLPEILAAFVQPNHPSVARLLGDAARVLEGWTGDGDLSGYQRHDPGRVFLTTAAIYQALADLDLTYANPPASFEQGGQKIRTPDQILGDRLATCLDLAVLMAAALEQAGLHPFVVLVEGHAFCGVWLIDESFAQATNADILRFRKRVELDEICVFDPTIATSASPPPFKKAVATGKKHLEDVDAFHCALDIKRARLSRIRPLPTRLQAQQMGDASDGEMAANGRGGDGETIPEVILQETDYSDVETPAVAVETPATRLDRWRRRLLDLTLRNRLLNFVETNKTIACQCQDLATLEDLLAEGTALRIEPRLTLTAQGDPRSAEALNRREDGEALNRMLVEDLKSRRLRADLGEERLQRKLIEVYRAARVGLEEGGTSGLYLALGMLVWYESASSEQPRIAPILLVPVELVRRSVQQGFQLRRGDDDICLNTTLAEKLAADFDLHLTGLDPLPQDAAGVDVLKVLQMVRRAVKEIDRWEVRETAQLGFFSFTKFLMWRDLQERHDILETNPVVHHLVHMPGLPFAARAPFPTTASLDAEHAPSATFCPMDADSSQLRAVYAAAAGNSFVLEGPPGTGKSQTITNLIAQCLAEGRSVLFVSEKIAALNVVHTRLQRVGLGDFCLELHSNKTRKQDVVQQLASTLRMVATQDAADWESQAGDLERLRGDLNAYVNALHMVRANGETVYHALSVLTARRDVQRLRLRWPSTDAHTPQTLRDLRETVEQARAASRSCGPLARHVWRTARRGDWSAAWQSELVESMNALGETLDGLRTALAQAASRLGDGMLPDSLAGLALLRRLADLLLAKRLPAQALGDVANWSETRPRIEGWLAHGRARDVARDATTTTFTDAILAADLPTLARDWLRVKQANPLLRWFLQWRYLRGLRPYTSHGLSPAKDGLTDALTQAIAWQREQRALDAANAEAVALLGPAWQPEGGAWETVDVDLDWVEALRNLAFEAADGDVMRAATLRRGWMTYAAESAEYLRGDGSAALEWRSVMAALDAFDAARMGVETALDLADDAWATPSDPGIADRVDTQLATWLSAIPALRAWCAWRRVREGGVAQGLGPLLEAHERGDVGEETLAAIFDRSYYQWWYEAVSDTEPVLRDFLPQEHERLIARFRELDARYIELTRALIVARLAARIPLNADDANPNSETGILNREAGKKRNQMAVRRLVQSIPNLLTRLKPCLLMSPISVAQYLDATHPPFDLVVFDEASQIPVWDAVGAIARAASAVVVGDPKQLPPTNFFEKHDAGEELDEDDVEDLESILDECLAAQLPVLTLDWHYRSRHESLIAFSNFRYYANRLFTFPSPARVGLGVSSHRVPGAVYDKGRTRTNRGEAEAVVAEIVRRLTAVDTPRHSIGVVTFSLAQQTLVEDLLEAARAAHPAIDPFFTDDVPEPVFVKNLENVQGDERDIILFSICYGPDAQGKVSMNFGPLNRDGGERRLNVAVTRARREVHVYTTLRPEEIDLSRTQAQGVRDLKAFLEYAERGTSAIATAVTVAPNAEYDSAIERDLHSALTQRGYTVHPQVGCSSYRIDLAVVDPAHPDRYLLGIECDGANYLSAGTARDRDKLRESVLTDLGWQLHRIWSTDWWLNPGQALKHVVEALEDAAASPPDRRPEVGINDRPHPAIGFDAVAEEPANTVADDPSGNDAVTSSEPSADANATGASDAPPSQRTATESRRYVHPVYTPWWCPAEQGGAGTAFFLRASTGQLAAHIQAAVAAEGPISVPLLTRRLARAWDISRITARVRERMDELVAEAGHTAHDSGGLPFLWRADQKPASYSDYRVPSQEDGGSRDIEDIAIEELANAAAWVHHNQLGLPHRDWVRETARLMGFPRLGGQIETRVEAAIAYHQQRQT